MLGSGKGFLGFLLLMSVAASLTSSQTLNSTSNEDQGEESPIIADDGQDNFLILDSDEIGANAQLLSLLSRANTEEVEEIVDSNPRYREVILNRIREAVESKRIAKQQLEQQNLQQHQSDDGARIAQEQPQRSSEEAQRPLGLPLDSPKLQEPIDDDEVDDDERLREKLRLANMKTNALKIFKIGSSLKAKLAAMAKKKKKKKKTLLWPHLQYKLTNS